MKTLAYIQRWFFLINPVNIFHGWCGYESHYWNNDAGFVVAKEMGMVRKLKGQEVDRKVFWSWKWTW